MLLMPNTLGTQGKVPLALGRTPQCQASWPSRPQARVNVETQGAPGLVRASAGPRLGVKRLLRRRLGGNARFVCGPRATRVSLGKTVRVS